jgi:hypothetical protein
MELQPLLPAATNGSPAKTATTTTAAAAAATIDD